MFCGGVALFRAFVIIILVCGKSSFA